VEAPCNPRENAEAPGATRSGARTKIRGPKILPGRNHRHARGPHGRKGRGVARPEVVACVGEVDVANVATMPAAKDGNKDIEIS